MNSASRTCLLLAVAGLAWLAISATSLADDVGTSFTYQGFLEKPAGTALTDTCDFRIGLWDAATGGNQQGNSPQTIPAIDVESGVFTAVVDFGTSTFNGDARWLGIEVKCSGDPSFILLSPRVELTPAPYSIRAGEGVGGQNALNVTPAGDVGIGTTTPTAQLDVVGAARTNTLEITGGVSPLRPLEGWGQDNFGQATVPSGAYIAVAAGEDHGVAIGSDGTLIGWGNDDSNQTNVPIGTFIAVSANHDHNIAIRSDGTLVGWGDPGFGVLNVPAGQYIAVSAGWDHAIALRTDGSIATWGNSNGSGQLDVPLPNTGFTAISAGAYYNLALKADGSITCWGNCAGVYSVPVPNSGFVSVAAAHTHSLALKTDGSIMTWGNNLFGQRDVPPPNSGFVAIAANAYHSLGLRALGGAISAWGKFTEGQTTVPIPNEGYIALAAGNYFSLAIRSVPDPTNPALYLHHDSAFKPGSNTWTIFSDRRLKKNIKPLAGALDHLLLLRGVTFQWVDPTTQGGITGTQMGLIADEVQRAFPQWIGRDAKGYQTLTVGGFEALTAEAMRELRAEKDRQLNDKDCEIAELRKEMAELKAAVNALTAPNAGGTR